MRNMGVGEVASSRLISNCKAILGIAPSQFVETHSTLDDAVGMEVGVEEALISYYELTGGIVPFRLVW